MPQLLQNRKNKHLDHRVGLCCNQQKREAVEKLWVSLEVAAKVCAAVIRTSGTVKEAALSLVTEDTPFPSPGSVIHKGYSAQTPLC